MYILYKDVVTACVSDMACAHQPGKPHQARCANYLYIYGHLWTSCVKRWTHADCLLLDLDTCLTPEAQNGTDLNCRL